MAKENGNSAAAFLVVVNRGFQADGKEESTTPPRKWMGVAV